MSEKLKYLHLEDEPTIVDLTRRLIEKEGYEVETQNVETREDFLQAIENQTFDLIIADYSLPHFDGLTALNLLRERNEDLPFILFSGSIGEEKAIASLRNGATDYVLKQNIKALPPAVSRAFKESQFNKNSERAELAIKESEKRYRSLFEGAPDGVLVIDKQGLIIDCNKTEENLTGYSRENLVGKKVVDLLDEKSKMEFKANFSTLQNEGSADGEVELVRKDGSIITIWRKAKATYGTNGTFHGAVIYNRDISGQREAEEANQNMGRILDASLNEIFIFDAHTLKFLQMNRGAKDNLGFTENECCDLTPYDIKPEFTRESFEAFIKPLREGQQEKIRFTTVHERKDGSQYPVEVFLQLSSYAGKSAFVAIISDITERKRAENIQQVMLRVATAALDTFSDQQFYAILKNELNKVLDTSNFFIGLYDASSDYISFPYMEDEKDRFQKVPAANTISSFVINGKKSILLNGDEVMGFINKNKMEMVGTPAQCWLGVPLITDNEVHGLLVVQDYNDSNAYDEQDKSLLEFVSSQVSASIKRKDAESQVYQLSRSVDQSPASTVITDLSGTIQYVNSKFCQVTGYTKEEALGQNPRVLKSGEMSPEGYENLWKTITSGDVWRGRFHNKKKDGELFWEDATIGPIKNDKGEATHYLAVKEDITRLVEDETRLSRLNQQNDILLASFPSVLMVMNAEEKIIRWNKKAAEVFNLGWEKVRHMHFHDLELSWDWGRIIDGISMCRDQEDVYLLQDVTFERSPGENGFLDVSIVPFTDDEAINDGFLIHAEDITEKKIAEGQQAHAQKLESIGQLAAGIAHEINTPSQYVGDNTHFLKDSFNDLNKLFDVFNKMQQGLSNESTLGGLLADAQSISEEIDLEFLLEEIPVAIEQSLDGIDKVSKIVRAMKEFSHPGGRDKSLIDLNNAIENTITVSRNEWKYAAEMETNFDESLTQVLCFPDELNQVILNMIINASHAISAKFKEGGQLGKITIETHGKDSMAEIYIRDNGSGMPDEVKKKIFDPFYTTKEVGKGTGQGLTISHDVIVNKHQGTIEVTSEQGEGTTFIIKLPVDNE